RLPDARVPPGELLDDGRQLVLVHRRVLVSSPVPGALHLGLAGIIPGRGAALKLPVYYCAAPCADCAHVARRKRTPASATDPILLVSWGTKGPPKLAGRRGSLVKRILTSCWYYFSKLGRHGEPRKGGARVIVDWRGRRWTRALKRTGHSEAPRAICPGPDLGG